MASRINQHSRTALEGVGYELGDDGAVEVPIRYQREGVAAAKIECDAVKATSGIAIQVETGPGAADIALRRVLEAALSDAITYLVILLPIAAPKRRTTPDDVRAPFTELTQFLDLVFTSSSIELSLDGILVIGY